jgi:hypothetical protein
MHSFKPIALFSTVPPATQLTEAWDFSHKLRNANDAALRSEENSLLPCKEERRLKSATNERLQPLTLIVALGADARLFDTRALL